MAYSCKFNPWVSCKDRAGCSHCGWNPEETRHRLERRKYSKKETAPDAANIEDGRPKGQTHYTKILLHDGGNCQDGTENETPQ